MKRSSERKAVLPAVFLILGLACLCQADPIKIGFAGLVDSVGDDYNLLQGAVHSGDSISGFYIYDSSTSDSEPTNINLGFYQHSTSPYGMTITIAGLTFQTDPANVDFAIAIRDNYNEPWDYYTVTSNSNLPLDNGLSIDALWWQLDDHSGTVFSSDALPLTPPDLSQWQGNALQVNGGSYPFPSPGEKTLFGITGHVTDVWLVPEPATLLLFSLSALFLRKRAKNIS
jgi:hypothetical protein